MFSVQPPLRRLQIALAKERFSIDEDIFGLKAIIKPSQGFLSTYVPRSNAVANSWAITEARIRSPGVSLASNSSCCQSMGVEL